MKDIRVWCLLGLLSVSGAAWSQAHQAGGDTVKAVTELENQWLQAIKTSNPDLIAADLSDKLVNTGDDGKVTNKADTLAEIKANKWTSVEYEDVQVRVYGDTALATGGFKGKGTDASGKPLDVHVRWTDTWVKMAQGKWQCVASQDTPIKKM